RLLGEYDRAIVDYRQALMLRASAAIYVQRGAVHRLQGALAEAIADCTAAIELDPQHAGAHAGRADAYLERGLWAAAVADYTVAIELQPNNPWSHFGRAQAHVQQETHDRAIIDLDRVLALNPQDRK